LLILPDSGQLGDRALDAKENLIKLTEENQKETDKFRIYGQDMLEDQDMARGEPMAYQELILRLKKMCPSLVIGDGGYPGAIQVRVPAWVEDEYTTKYVTGFMKEVLPEYSWITVDDKGLPKREHRGWATVLIALIRQGIVSYDKALQHFKEPTGQRAVRWQELIREAKYRITDSD